ncbi:MAG: universal stress protein [Proteobacteria bacterium]|nr:universal stress protein [Pseudomonadota bacterium]
MVIHSILAVTDLSPQGNRAVLRAAMLAAQHGALLKLMHASRDFAATPRPDAQPELQRLAAEVHARFDILVKRVGDASGHLQAVAEEARWVDLLVVGEHAQEKSARTFFCAHPLERLQRAVPCPILLARLEVFHRYRRILVAVDFTPDSKKMVKLAWALDGDAQVELFHALNTTFEGKLRYADVSERAIKVYRHESMRDAHERMFWLSDSSTARRNRVVAAIGRGDVARQAVIQQQHSSAELLVVGKRRSSRISDVLLGSVAQRVLWWSSGDVLLVPHDLRIDPRHDAAAVAVPPAPSVGARPAIGRAA